MSRLPYLASVAVVLLAAGYPVQATDKLAAPKTIVPPRSGESTSTHQYYLPERPERPERPPTRSSDRGEAVKGADSPGRPVENRLPNVCNSIKAPSWCMP